jgi:hypothetical protein
MGRGVGKTQQRILDELAGEQEQLGLTVVGLADRLGVSTRQVRTAVHALHHRGLLVLTKEFGDWKGQGEYGTKRSRFRDIDDADGDRTRYPNAHWGIPQECDEVFPMMTRPDGTQMIKGPPTRYRREYYFERQGMPTGVSLIAWLPEKREQWLAAQGRSAEQLGRQFGVTGSGLKALASERAKEL